MAPSFWKEFLVKNKELEEQNKVLYTILRDSTPGKLTNDTLTIMCSNSGSKSYLYGRKERVEELLSIHLGKKIRIDIDIEEKPVEEDMPLLNFQPSKEDVFRRSGLNVNYAFENYAVSPTNQIAFAAAQSVAQSPGTSYNPLFLYGGVGVGKTHLAQAIARHMLDTNTDNQVLFLSGERFMNELIEAIRAKTTARFRKKYRTLQLIIVDDIQFIAGKQTVQEEFFHTFNSIVSGGGQVVLTSDRPPFEIKNLEDRLRSRFSGGLIVDIQQPNFELRTAILLIKAREKNIEIDMAAAQIVAESVSDTRSLEGMLLSLYARTVNKNGGRIDLSVVEEFFQKKVEKRKQRISPQQLIKAVCSFYQVKQTQLKGTSRKSDIALIRQIAMYLLRTELNINLEEVAYMVKRKDHTTVLHAVDKIQGKMMKDTDFRAEIDMILNSLRSST